MREVLNEVERERIRQDQKWGDTSAASMSVPLHTGMRRPLLRYGIPTADEAKARCEEMFAKGKGSSLDILVEEVCEAACELMNGEAEKGRAELVQVAAVAVAMIERIDRAKAVLFQPEPEPSMPNVGMRYGLAALPGKRGT